jgi:hypothetical protein
MSVDDRIEGIGRRLAARTTRRTFLDRVGKLGVLVAGGPALATLLVERAEARVCGQSGVSPKCPTFSCDYPDSVWGWCWYASGTACCAGGGLKKICDCCTRAWPNVHGYCPSGTNVRCIVESCHADPRVMYKPVERAAGLTAAQVAAARARHVPGSATVVLGDAQDPAAAVIAGPVAVNLAAPLLLTGRDRLASGVIAEIQRLRANRVVLVGPVPPTHGEELAAYGIAVEHLGAGERLEQLSRVVAEWVMGRTGTRRAVVVERGVDVAVAAAAATSGGAVGRPLVVGIDTAKEMGLRDVWKVGPQAAARTAEIPGWRTTATTPLDISHQLAGAAVVDGLSGAAVVLVPAGSANVAPGVTGAGGVLLYHDDGTLGHAYGWIVNNHGKLARGIVAGSLGTLGDRGIYELQGALHQFDVHRLQGVSGQGLPVVSQPTAEREIGQARIAGTPEPEDGSYWSSRARG